MGARKIGLNDAGENRWEWTRGRKGVRVGPTAKIGGSGSAAVSGRKYACVEQVKIGWSGPVGENGCEKVRWLK